MDLDLDQPPPKPPKMALWKSATIAVLSLAVITAVVWLIAAGPAKGRKAFQRPMKEGVELLNAVQDVYLSKEVTIA